MQRTFKYTAITLANYLATPRPIFLIVIDFSHISLQYKIHNVK